MRPDLSSLPEEFTAPAPAKPVKRVKPVETPEERAERYRRKRRAQFVGVIVFSTLVLVAVIAAVVISQFSSNRGASSQSQQNTCSAPMKPAEPSGVTVNVYNMTTKPGMATDIGDQFTKREFKVGTVGNYSGPLTRPGRTSVRAVIKARPDREAQALAVQRQLPDAVFQADPTMKSASVDVYLLDQVPELNKTVDSSEGALVCR